MAMAVRFAASGIPGLTIDVLPKGMGSTDIGAVRFHHRQHPGLMTVRSIRKMGGSSFRSTDLLPRNSVHVETDLRVSKMNDGGIAQQQEKPWNLSPSTEVLTLWKAADAVCFDVDSTVCTDEGIDELAAFCGAGEAVASWTARAMVGSVPFEEALAARLDIIRPSAADLNNFLLSRPPRLTPGISLLVGVLHAADKAVYLVSGGFRQMINPVAEILNVPPENVFANKLLFARDGTFAGFDGSEPTSRSGGKAEVIRRIKGDHGYKLLVMVGDGATDLENLNVVVAH
eukprot:TRINITY_DN1816_c0_g1_i2.p1 TRINITY_DN1816_c0_g1~~TRINITY_DN1816_c0_g1_i2.p1  ORF type:complete len:296 (+),score=62.15 TRINITY_DN1816_c0_g1_i2:33-890(+)